MDRIISWILFFMILSSSCTGHMNGQQRRMADEPVAILPGAWQTQKYFPLLEGKKLALLGNHSSLIAGVHLADSLLNAGFALEKVFSPEHGFRGQAAAGEQVQSGVDVQTGLPVISLYGAHRRPEAKDLEGIDLVIFDIQDVGARFYTYISTMSYMMEEAARMGIPMLILDRPNPNGHYVDGPIREEKHASFVGLHPIPLVHGMTVAEYAQMVNGQGWLGDGLVCELHIVPVANYNRNMWYELPVAPSPNLPNMTSIMLYPGLCMFEGTEISLGRGTDFPFQVFGHPALPPEFFPFTFTPESRSAAPNPPQKGNRCFGRDMRTDNPQQLHSLARFDIGPLLEVYAHFPQKEEFFNNFFSRLAGTDELKQQIIAGWSENEIRATWQSGLEAFRQMRKPYLIYPDTDQP